MLWPRDQTHTSPMSPTLARWILYHCTKNVASKLTLENNDLTNNIDRYDKYKWNLLTYSAFTNWIKFQFYINEAHDETKINVENIKTKHKLREI